MSGLSETELAAAVVGWLKAQHWEVYQEVRFGQCGVRADIIAVNGPVTWAIECKTSLGLAVLSQAERHMTIRRSIAIPMAKGKRWGRQRAPYRYPALWRICSTLRVGVLEVEFSGSGRFRRSSVEETIDAPLVRENHRFRYIVDDHLHEEQKSLAPAGTDGGGYYTPYRRTMNEVRRILEAEPGLTIKEIMKRLTEHHYKSDITARCCIMKMLSSSVEPWCRVDRSTRPHRFFVAEPEKS